MSDKAKISVQIGSFPTLLTIAFIVLKLCNVISWSWWWVLSPIWIPIGEDFEDVCCRGVDQLEIKWLPEGTAFRIDEYDGFETVITNEQLYYIA